MYCRHREGHSLHYTDIAVPSPQKCLLHTDWETLSVAGQACPAGLENSVVSEVCVHVHVWTTTCMSVYCMCVCVWGGGDRTAGELKPMRDSANKMSTDHSMQNT